VSEKIIREVNTNNTDTTKVERTTATVVRPEAKHYTPYELSLFFGTGLTGIAAFVGVLYTIFKFALNNATRERDIKDAAQAEQHKASHDKINEALKDIEAARLHDKHNQSQINTTVQTKIEAQGLKMVEVVERVVRLEGKFDNIEKGQVRIEHSLERMEAAQEKARSELVESIREIRNVEKK